MKIRITCNLNYDMIQRKFEPGFSLAVSQINIEMFWKYWTKCCQEQLKLKCLTNIESLWLKIFNLKIKDLFGKMKSLSEYFVNIY